MFRGVALSLDATPGSDAETAEAITVVLSNYREPHVSVSRSKAQARKMHWRLGTCKAVATGGGVAGSHKGANITAPARRPNGGLVDSQTTKKVWTRLATKRLEADPEMKLNVERSKEEMDAKALRRIGSRRRLNFPSTASLSLSILQFCSPSGSSASHSNSPAPLVTSIAPCNVRSRAQAGGEIAHCFVLFCFMQLQARERR
jgi:hypothetical protein